MHSVGHYFKDNVCDMSHKMCLCFNKLIWNLTWFMHKYFFIPRETAVDTSGRILRCRCHDLLRMKALGPWPKAPRDMASISQVPYLSQKLCQLYSYHFVRPVCSTHRLLHYWWLLHDSLLLLLLLSLSLSPLYRVFTRMSVRQTISLGDTMLQLLFRFIVNTVSGAYVPHSYSGSDGLLCQHFPENVCSA